MTRFQRAFLESGAFILIHYLILSPAVCLIYQSGLTWACSPLSPPLPLADICKQITPVLYEVKDKERGCCVHWAMKMMTEMAINGCSLHAQA